LGSLFTTQWLAAVAFSLLIIVLMQIWMFSRTLLLICPSRSKRCYQTIFCILLQHGGNCVLDSKIADVVRGQAQHLGHLDPGPVDVKVELPLQQLALLHGAEGDQAEEGEPGGCQDWKGTSSLPDPLVHLQIRSGCGSLTLSYCYKKPSTLSAFCRWGGCLSLRVLVW
jgi:hypothetical protein